MEELEFKNGILIFRGIECAIKRIELIDDSSIHLELEDKTICLKCDSVLVNGLSYKSSIDLKNMFESI